MGRLQLKSMKSGFSAEGRKGRKVRRVVAKYHPQSAYVRQDSQGFQHVGQKTLDWSIQGLLTQNRIGGHIFVEDLGAFTRSGEKVWWDKVSGKQFAAGLIDYTSSNPILAQLHRKISQDILGVFMHCLKHS